LNSKKRGGEPTIEHEINEWTDRNGELLGASIFLSIEEVGKLRNGQPIQIEPQDNS